MFYERQTAGYLLRIRVTPNAAKPGPSGIFTDETGADFLKLALSAVPEKGKANAELIKYLSKTLGIGKSLFTFISGETDRYKKLHINVVPSAELDQALNNMEKKR